MLDVVKLIIDTCENCSIQRERDTLVAVDEEGPYRRYQAHLDAQPVKAFAEAVEGLVHETYLRGGQAFQVPWRIVRIDKGG